ncbi:MAG TPA: YjcZ family sporulation protein [Cerasibacillus sp.]
MSYHHYCGGYGYSAPVSNSGNYGNCFTLIVVLFILLIIVGATFYC